MLVLEPPQHGHPELFINNVVFTNLMENTGSSCVKVTLTRLSIRSSPSPESVRAYTLGGI